MLQATLSGEIGVFTVWYSEFWRLSLFVKGLKKRDNQLKVMSVKRDKRK